MIHDLVRSYARTLWVLIIATPPASLGTISTLHLCINIYANGMEVILSPFPSYKSPYLFIIRYSVYCICDPYVSVGEVGSSLVCAGQ